MIRLVVSGLIIITSIILFILGAILLYYGWKWVKRMVKSWSDYWRNRQEKSEREGRNRLLPGFMRKGIKRFDHTLDVISDLPQDWKERLLQPATLAEAVIEMAAHKKKQARSIRTFFTVSLPAFEKFVIALQDDHKFMNEAEKAKARDNVLVLEQDFKRSFEKISDSRQFDFDVMMESIKQRLEHR